MTFIELSNVFQACLATVIFISCTASLYSTVTALIYRQKKRYAVLSAILLFIGSFTLVLMSDILSAGNQYEFEFKTTMQFIKLPAVSVILFTVAFVTANIFTALKSFHRRNTHLSVNAVKESVDSLPTGLCFYAANGMPLLTNKRMDSLCREITGFALLDANKLWLALSKCKIKSNVTVIRITPEPTFKLPDGSVWSFMHSTGIYIGTTEYFQITATDITDEHSLSESLDTQIEQLKLMNARLQRYNETVYDVTRDEEILNTKIKIHDKMGRALLTTRRYIEYGDVAIDSNELLQLWKQNVTLLRYENESEVMSDAMDELNAAASLVGVKICVEGKLPQKNKGLMRLFTLAALEALNNAVHHAQAKTLTISSLCQNRDCIFIFTNDGSQPVKPFREGGGLAGLRQMIERAGGKVEVKFIPIFSLTLTIPNNEVTDYDKRIDS